MHMRGSTVPLTMAITVPLISSTMSQRSANLNWGGSSRSQRVRDVSGDLHFKQNQGTIVGAQRGTGGGLAKKKTLEEIPHFHPHTHTHTSSSIRGILFHPKAEHWYHYSLSISCNSFYFQTNIKSKSCHCWLIASVLRAWDVHYQSDGAHHGLLWCLFLLILFLFILVTIILGVMAADLKITKWFEWFFPS